MSLRTALAIAAAVLVTGFSFAAEAGTSATKTKNADKTACTEHTKKMDAMKTSAERESYCKEHEDCVSHNCTRFAAHHKTSTKHHATAPATPPATTPPAN
ncbi:MAG: hypothetical protein ACHQ6T_07905 [Myxococcota bacterium]